MARALYIHWPFCLSKCPYCDFNSHVRASVDHDQWQRALIADLRHEARLCAASGANERLESIFFGGGTPSLMPPRLVEALIEQAARLWPLADDIEITLEANPSSVEAENFAALAGAGVNRVSLGVQALDDEALRFLGRLHGAREALDALETAKAHFARVSFDLIYARPHQGARAWRRELERALALGTGHLSLYQLTIEPGTRFATMARRGEIEPIDEDAAADLFAMTREITRAHGLEPYEISNHARAGQESRHNLAYWRYQDYCGIGPGAHARRMGLACERHRKPENWLSSVMEKGHGIARETALTPRDSASEALLMGLRLAEGVDLSALSRRFGLAEAAMVNEAKLALCCAEGLMWRRGARIGLSEQGAVLLDAILGMVVADELVGA